MILDADIQVDDTVLEIERKQKRELQRLRAIKRETLDEIRGLRKMENELCLLLAADRLQVGADCAPTKHQVWKLKMRLSMLQNEKKNRERKVSAARAKVLALWTRLGESPASAFEKDLFDDTVQLTEENVQKATDLVGVLTTEVKERTESFEARTEELHYLRRKLGYQSESNYGITTELVKAVSDAPCAVYITYQNDNIF
jgi:hypothetical protein